MDRHWDTAVWHVTVFSWFGGSLISSFAMCFPPFHMNHLCSRPQPWSALSNNWLYLQTSCSLATPTPNSWVCQNHPSADLTMFSWYVNLSATFPPSKPNLDLKVHYYNYNCLYIYPLLSVPSSPLNLPGKVWVLHGSILCSHPVYAYSWTSLEKNSGWC